MDELARERVTAWLEALPEVRWDRFCTGGGTTRVYGWLDRPDGRADFVLLDLDGDDDAVAFVTSSARHSAEFTRRLFGAVEHVPCQRVSELYERASA